MTNIQEVLNSLSFDSNSEEVMTSNPDNFTSNPSAREVELEKEVARLTEKVEELSNFCHYVCKRLDSVEKTQNKFIDTASKKIQNNFENLEFVYDNIIIVAIFTNIRHIIIIIVCQINIFQLYNIVVNMNK